MFRTSRQRRVALLLGAAALGLGGLSLWKAAPRLVTRAALRDASRRVPAIAEKSAGSPRDICALKIGGAMLPVERATHEAANAVAAEYGAFFRAGYFDHACLVRRIPASGCTPEALPALVVIGAYFRACGDRLDEDLLLSPPASNPAVEELLRWIRPVFTSPSAKEALVSILFEPHELLPGRTLPAHPIKIVLIAALTLRDHLNYGDRDRPRPDVERIANHVLSGISSAEWSAVLAQSHHPAEKVRTGSLLLLCHHPDRASFLNRARAALEDPSELPRIAAALALAYHGDPGGRSQLIAGVTHRRWEIRWWCAKSIASLGGGAAREAISDQHYREPDGWVKIEMERMRSTLR